MTTRLLCFAFLFALTFVACNEDKVVTAAREVGEEGAQLVQKVGPESELPGQSAIPTQTITIEETLSAVKASGSLLQVPVGAANGVIDRWIQSLRGNSMVDDSDLLVENLTKLKMLLGAGTMDNDALEEVLERLAKETQQAAEDNDNKAVALLGQALEEAANAID